MASTTRGRVETQTAGRRREQSSTVGGRSRLGAVRVGIVAVVSRLPRLALTDRLHRELLGAGLVLIAALSAWALSRGEQDGRLVAWWRDVVVAAYGSVGGWLVPTLLILTAVRIFQHHPGPVLEPRHYLGGFGFAVATVGLLQLQAGVDGALPGGNLGVGVAKVALDYLGEIAGGFVLYAFGTASIFVLANVTPSGFFRDLRGLTPAAGRIRSIGQRRGVATRGDFDDDDDDDDRVDAEIIDVGPNPELHGEWSKGGPRKRSRFRRQGGDDELNAPFEALAPVVSAVLDGVEEPKAASKDAPPMPPELVINVPKRATRVPKNSEGASVSVLSDGPQNLPLPELDFLPYYDAAEPDTSVLERRARLIEEKLASFRVEASVREINPGPAVTQYALEPGEGVKVRRITELQNDLALALAAPQIRIEAPVPGMARVGIEVPNAQIMTVGLRETLEAPNFGHGKQKLPVPLGRDVNGRYVIHDLTKMPHLLIAGATGSGKSVCLNGIISTFLLTRRPDEVRLVMIDPKMVELTSYNGVPHLQCPVVTEMDKVVAALRLVLREMERRYDLFRRLGVRNLDGYRMKIADEPSAEKLPYLVVIIDELADLMMTTPDEVESLLVRLAQMARATGIHLIIATQRPSVDVLTGLIKANVPSRIAFMVSSVTDSRVILDMPGADKLLGKGDMLFLPPDAAKPQRIQGVFVDDKDVQGIVDHWHAVTPVPHYAEEWLNLPSSGGVDGESGDAEDDPLWDQSLGIVRRKRTASASMLQRELRVGYNRAARLIQRMEDEEIIGPADGIKGRPVLIGDDE